MTPEERRIVRDGFGAIEDEMRSQRALLRGISVDLKALIKMSGGEHAKVLALREDHEALVDKHNSFERRVIAALPALAR